MAMRRADRKTQNDINEVNNPRSPVIEAITYKELKDQNKILRIKVSEVQKVLIIYISSAIAWIGFSV
jgi:hypothetical protein